MAESALDWICRAIPLDSNLELGLPISTRKRGGMRGERQNALVRRTFYSSSTAGIEHVERLRWLPRISLPASTTTYEGREIDKQSTYSSCRHVVHVEARWQFAPPDMALQQMPRAACGRPHGTWISESTGVTLNVLKRAIRAVEWIDQELNLSVGLRSRAAGLFALSQSALKERLEDQARAGLEAARLDLAVGILLSLVDSKADCVIVYALHHVRSLVPAKHWLSFILRKSVFILVRSGM